MRNKNFAIGSTAALLVLVLCGTATHAAAQTETILYSFGSGIAGKNPGASLIFDTSGNLYGTTWGGGAHGVGTVFELTRSIGGWRQKELYAFNKTGGDGYNPIASLTFDASGNLWGTTTVGGTYDAGAVFELIPQAGGAWQEEVVYSFNPATGDGANPYSNVIFDAKGNIYGTTVNGGSNSAGIVFEVSPQPGGGWVETIPKSLVPSSNEGYWPFYGLVLDSAGDLWGTTSIGGGFVGGTVFELIPTRGGGWAFSVPLWFDPAEGMYPVYGNLVLGREGNLYGATSWGGYNSEGTVFEIHPEGDRTVTETVLYSFPSSATDGVSPVGGMVFDAHGNLYGTTEYVGSLQSGGGTVFELSEATGGTWTEQVLHTFSLTGGDGYNPYAGVIVDASGNVYGTTYDGGAYGDGTVFEITR